MSDFIVYAPDLPTLNAVASNVPNLWTPTFTDFQGVITPGHISEGGFGTDNGGWAWSYVGQWFVPTGATTTDIMGNTVPVMAPKSGVYGVLRWNDTLATLQALLPTGATVSTNPQTNITTITAGSVTLTTPLPSDTPVRF